MSLYWFQNPLLLLENMSECYPKKEFSADKKINSIARLAIIYALLIIFLKLDMKYLAISVCLLLLSIFLGTTENFKETINKENNTEECQKPTVDNPFMNFTVGDQMENPNRPSACPLDKVREEEISNYRKTVFLDPTDLFGKIISDRNFYTMPSTTVVNDQEGFLKFTYGDFGKCKADGKDCLKHRDNRFHRGRYYYQY
jgi:hypothetical protein